MVYVEAWAGIETGGISCARCGHCFLAADYEFYAKTDRMDIRELVRQLTEHDCDLAGGQIPFKIKVLREGTVNGYSLRSVRGW